MIQKRMITIASRIEPTTVRAETEGGEDTELAELAGVEERVILNLLQLHSLSVYHRVVISPVFNFWEQKLKFLLLPGSRNNIP